MTGLPSPVKVNDSRNVLHLGLGARAGRAGVNLGRENARADRRLRIIRRSGASGAADRLHLQHFGVGEFIERPGARLRQGFAEKSNVNVYCVPLVV